MRCLRNEMCDGYTPSNTTNSPGGRRVTGSWGTHPRLHVITLYCFVVQNLNPLLLNPLLTVHHLLITPPKADESSSSGGAKDTNGGRQPPPFSADSGAPVAPCGVDTDDPE